MKAKRYFSFYIVCVVCAWLAICCPPVKAATNVGAVAYDGGTTFRVWAPNATDVEVHVYVGGIWTNKLMSSEADGYWFADVSGAGNDGWYFYRIPSDSLSTKIDPRVMKMRHSTGQGQIYDHSKFDWQGDNFTRPDHNDLVIYQMHIGTFNKAQHSGTGPAHFWDTLKRIKHIKDLGFNAIQLMPIAEFASGTSMGYNPASPYTVETDYGGPNGLKTFVRECHKHGIAVFLDMVHNHYGPEDNILWRFDNWYENEGGGIYFYNDSRGTTPWGGPRPDYSREQVRDYIRDNFKMWIDDFHVDGYRWDSVYTMKYANDVEIQDAVDLIKDINAMLKNDYTGIFNVAEDHSAGLDFDGEWEAGESQEFGARLRWILSRANDSDRDMNLLAGEINESSLWRVLYIESHDTTWEENDKVRSVKEFDGNDPQSVNARKKALLAGAATLTSVGVPQVFQGQEMAEDKAFTPHEAMSWDNETAYPGIIQAFTDMISLRRNLGGASQGLKGTGCDVDVIDNANKVIAYHRYDSGGVGDDVVVVLNCANRDWNGNYNVKFPHAGTWYVSFNSDLKKYGNDFGGIGDTQVTVATANADTPISIGKYSAIIFTRKKHSLTEPGTVAITPPTPADCEDITIRYTPEESALKDVSPIYAHIGYNGEENGVNYLMVADGDDWVYTYSSTTGVKTINISFTDASQENWDDNNSAKWNVNISGCGDPTPSSVTFNPAAPNGCGDVTITYNPGQGVLEGVDPVYIHVGRNDWKDVISPRPEMTKAGSSWTYTYSVPDNTYKIDCAFFDGTTWDNNDGQDWHVNVSNCGEPPPLRIVAPATGTSVDNSQTTIDLSGTASSDLIGNLTWSNALNGQTGTIPAATNWAISNIPLAVGSNLVTVTGTNADTSVNATDSASDTVYNDGWTDADNGGSNWGGSWAIQTSSNSGVFIAESSSQSNLNVGTKAWGLWANNGDVSRVERPFATQMQSGDVFKIKFENNGIDTGAATGFILLSSDGTNAFELMFYGGQNNYIINDNTESRDTSIGWTDKGLDVEFTLTSENTYSVKVNTATLTGTLPADAKIERLAVWNASTGNGEESNVYFTDIELSSDGQSITVSDSVAVIRRDLLTNIEVESIRQVGNVWHITIGPETSDSQTYDLMWCTNLVSPNWRPVNLDHSGNANGSSLELNHASEELVIFYKAITE